MNFLPAILMGGPPHAGKSVLFYRLTSALRAQGIDHYALRACADGEGNWFHEIKPDQVDTLRVKLTGEWPPAFVQSISRALEHRCLPFLVDMGGNLKPSQECLLEGCTHSILLLREDQPEATLRWRGYVETYNLLPVAQLLSRREGQSVVTGVSPVLEGIITGLERATAREGAEDDPLFAALLARIRALFTSHDCQKQRQMYIEHSPTELMLDIPQELRAFTTDSKWQPEMLPSLLKGLPEKTPLSLYGSGPTWLYAALAAYEDPQPFYLFDPRMGWIPPVPVELSKTISETKDIRLEITRVQDAIKLTLSFPYDRLEYLRSDPLLFPHVEPEAGLVIDGRIPYWLLTSLTRLYKNAGVAWIATSYPPLDASIVVYSRVAAFQPGDRIANI